ncbi:uncharacterized protein LOC143956158 isoform X2 [Lithobates pipiens]
MEDDRRKKIRSILKLTVEFICQLTGEDCIIVRKTSGTNGRPNLSQRPSESPTMECPPPSLTPEQHHDWKLLQLINKIIELLTGEVPIRCQDVTVYFSMEEWEYLEGHRDLYKDILMDNWPPLTSPDGSSNPPEMCPNLMDSRYSTQKSHNTLQEKVVNQKTPEMVNCSSREKRPEEPATKTTDESSNRNPPECPLLSSREPSQMAYFIQQKEVHNHIHAQALRQTSDSEYIEKICKVPAFETTEQNGNFKAETNDYFFTSNQNEASPAVDNSTITCGDDTNCGAVKDTNNVSKSKATKEKRNRNSNDVVGHSPISSKQPEANAITSDPTELGTITSNQTENDTIILKQTEVNVIMSNQDKADTITSKQTEADTITLMQTEVNTIISTPTEEDSVNSKQTEAGTITLMQTEANTIISTPTEEDSVNSKQTEADTITLMQAEANTIISTPTEEDSMNSKQTEAETLTSMQTKADTIISTLTEEYSMTSTQTEADTVNPIQEDAVTSNQTEADTIAFNPTQEDSISSEQTEAGALTSNPTQEDSIPSKQTETDAITSNPTKENITTSNPNEEDALTSNQIEADLTSPNPTESNAFTSKQAEPADSPTRAFRGNIIPRPLMNTNSVFSLEVPESISHRNPAEEDAMLSKQTEADVITSNPNESNASNSKPAEPAVSPTRAFRGSILPHPLMNTNSVEELKILKSRKTSAVVGQATITSNQTEANSALSKPIRAFRDEPLLPPPEALKKNTIKNSTPVAGHSTITSNQTEANSAVNYPTTKDDALPVPLKDANDIFNFKAIKNKRIRNSRSVVGHGIFNFNQAEANSDVATPRRAFRDETFLAPLRNTPNRFNFKDKTLRITIQNSLAMVGHRAAVANQIEADPVVDNPTTALDLTHPTPLTNTNNVSNFEAMTYKKDKVSKTVVGHSSITSIQTKVISALNNPTASADETLPAPLKDTNDISNSKTTEEKQISNFSSVVGRSPITRSQVEANATSNNPTTTCRDDSILAPVNYTIDLSNSSATKIFKTTTAFGHSAIMSSQTESDSALKFSTIAYRDDTLPAPLKDMDIVCNPEAMTNENFKNSKSTVGHNAIISNQTKAVFAVDNPTTSHRVDPQITLLSNPEAITNENITNSKSTVDRSAISSNQTKADSAMTNPTIICREDSLIASLKDTNNISNYKETKKNTINNSTSVIVYSTLTSKQTEADSALNKPATTCRDNSHGPPLNDTDSVSNSDMTHGGKSVNPTSVVGHGAITSNQTEGDPVVEQLTGAFMDNTDPASLTDPSNISNSEAMKNTNMKNSKCTSGHSAPTLNQTKGDSAVYNPTPSCRENAHTASLKDTNLFSNSKETIKDKIKNSTSVIVYSAITSNRTKADSALNKQATTCRDHTRSPPLNDTNKVSNSDTANGENYRNPTPVVGHDAISLNQTKVDSVVENPTAVCRDNTLPASVTETNNVFNIQATKKSFTYSAITSNQTKADSASNKQATTCKDNTRFPPLCDTQNISDSDTANRENDRNPTPVVGHDAISSNQTEVDAALENATAACSDNALPDCLKDTNNISNLQATKERITFSAITSNPTEADSAFNKQATTCRDNTLSLPVNDTNKVSDSDTANRETIRNPTTVVGHDAISLNQTKVDSVVENPTAVCRDNTLPASLTNTTNVLNIQATKKRFTYNALTSNQTKADSASNKQATIWNDNTRFSPLCDTNAISGSDTANREIIRNPTSMVGHGAITLNQTEVDTVLENPTAACSGNTLPASLKDKHNISNFQATKKKITFSVITSNPTEADSALNKQATACKDNIFSPPLSDTNKVSDSGTANMEKSRNPTSAVGHGAVTLNQTEVDIVVENPTAACRNKTLPASLKDENNSSNFQANKKRIAYRAFTSNQTKADSALNKQATNSKGNTLSPPLSDTNKVSDSDTANMENIRNSTLVVGHAAINLNQTEVDSVVENPTAILRDKTLPASLKDTNNVSIFQLTKKRIAYSAFTLNRTKADSALSKQATTCKENTQSLLLSDTNRAKADSASNKQATTCKDNTLSPPLNDTNKVSDSDTANRENNRNLTPVVGHDTTPLKQTKVNSVVENPTVVCKDITLPASLTDTNNVSNIQATKKRFTYSAITSNQTAADSALNKQAATCKDNISSPSLSDTNKVSDSDTANMEKIRNPTPVVGHSAITLNQTEVDSVVENPTAACRDNTHSASLKDTSNISSFQATKKRITYKAMTSNRTKADSALNKQAKTCGDNTLSPPLSDTSKVSDSVNRKTPAPVVGHGAMSSNQTEVDSVVENPTAACRDNTLPASLKDTNNISNFRATRKRKSQDSNDVTSFSPITSSHTENYPTSNNPTPTCRLDSLLAVLKSTINKANAKAPQKMKSSTTVVGHNTIASNQTKSDSALNNPTISCSDNSLPAPSKGTDNVSKFETLNKIKITRSVVGHNAITSNQIKTDFAVDKLTESHRIFSPFVLLKDINKVCNYKDTIKNKIPNSKSVVGHNAIASNQSKVKSAVDSPTTSRRIESHIALFKDTNEVSKSEETKKNKTENSNSVVGYNTRTSNQSKVGSTVDNPTTSHKMDSHIALLQDTNNVFNYEERNKIKIKISKSMAGYSATTSIQSNVESAVVNPTTSRRVLSQSALLKNTNNVSNYEETKKNKTKNSKSVVGYNTRTSNKRKVGSTVDNSTTSRRVRSRIALLKETNNDSNDKATKKNKTKNSKSVVVYNAKTSNQSKADSAVDTPTTSHRIDSHITLLKGTNVFNYEETTNNKIRISKPVIGYSAITSIQNKVGSPVDNSTSRRVDSQVAVLKDINNVSTHEKTNENKIKIAKPMVGHNAIASNQSKVDSAVNNPTTSHKIVSIIALFKDSNNVPSNEDTIKNSKSVVDHNAIMSNQSQVDTAVDNPTTSHRTDPHIALVKDTNKVTNYKETKKNSKSGIIHSAITLNQTEADSAWNRPGTSCRDNAISPSLNYINNVSNSDMTKGEKIRNPTSADDHGAITPNQTNVDPAVHDPTGACRDNTLPASLKDPNNFPISKPTEIKTMKSSESAVGQSTITSNQTKVNVALNDPTACMRDSFPGPLKDANNVSNPVSTKGKEMKNSTAVDGNSTIGSNKPETNSNVDAPTGVCSGGTPTTPMNGTATISNSEQTEVKTQKNAKANHGPAQVGLSLNSPTKDCSDNPTAIAVKNRDNNFSKPKAPKVKRKRKRERKHKCPDCGKMFLFNAHLVVHYRTHTGERPFPCLECGKSFLCKTRLAAHQVFHSKERLYSCSECNKSFYNSTHLQVHRKIHKNERPYVCAECGKTFIHSSNYTKHLEIHKGVKNYLCSYCGKSFRQSSHLHSHQKQHTTDHGFSCHKCHKKFQTEGALISHYKSHRITPLSCSECGKHFINRVSFDRHRRVHTGHKLLSCPECGRCFINKTHLSVHQRTHSGEKPFACTSCEMRFSDKSAWKRHITRHMKKTPEERPSNAKGLDERKCPDEHTKQFQCLECEKFYKTEARLSNHQNRHHKESPFSCSDCGKCFANETLLAAHQKSHLAERHFSCLPCGMDFKTQLELETHQKSHSIDALLCSICGRRFALEEQLAMHQKRHLDETLFSCEKCNIAFKSQAELETHQKSHPEKKFSCIDCKLFFASEKRLAKHQRKHHGIKLFSCVKCSRGFKTELELETHQRNHPELNLVFCPDCGRCFTSETLLAAHQKQHLGEKGFLCSRCSKSFKTQHDLKVHQKNHPEEKPFLCGDCGRRFASEALLSAHQERHVSKKRYLCMSCGRGFNEKSNFEKHCRIHTGERPYKCSECEKTFSIKSNMIRHHKIHTGERPFKCLECGKSFRVKSNLLIHQKLHTGERAYFCDQCPKTFRDKSNYQRHKKSHTVVKRFTCTECGKGFCSPTQLSIHARTHSRQKFECAHCGKNFKNNWCLNKHMKTHKLSILSKAEKVAV